MLFIIFGFTSMPEWTILFDGETVKGLRGYKQNGFPTDDWVIIDGTLKTIPGRGIDLISEEIYKDFELELEWKVPVGGNSGIVYAAEGNYDLTEIVLERLDAAREKERAEAEKESEGLE